MNFLIDGDGIIVAKNLRGLSLHQELDKYVVKVGDAGGYPALVQRLMSADYDDLDWQRIT